MDLIGSMIKKGLEWKASIDDRRRDAVQEQKEQLQQILHKAKDTSLGKYYNFAGMMEHSDPMAEFQRRMPLADYDHMYNNWWKQALQYPDITWPGHPPFFARSSGTTGTEPKRIPVTEAMQQSIRQVSIAQITGVGRFDLDDDFFRREMLALSSTTQLEQVGSHREGEISAITASNIPSWFENMYRPGFEIASIENWDERVERIAAEAPNWDIGVLNGIPSWVLLMLRRIIEKHQLSTIHDLWPGLQVYTPGGVAFEPYRSQFEAIFGREVYIMDTYLASEGFFAFTSRPNTLHMELATGMGIFYEFIPFDQRGFNSQAEVLDQPLVHTLAEVEEDTEYALVITTCAGNYRYMIGDTITFKDKSRWEIVITGRTKHFLNVVGSQLTESRMEEAMESLRKDRGLQVEEYTVGAVHRADGEWRHHWILGIEGKQAPDEEVAQYLDNYFSKYHKNYEVARRKALRGLKVQQVSIAQFHAYQEKHRKKGDQVKTRKVVGQDEIEAFAQFVDQD